MQSALSRIWNGVAVSISYQDNYYTTGTSCMYVCQSICVRRMYIPNPSTMDRLWHKVSFLAEYSWFECRDFLLQNWLLYQV